MAYEQVSVQNNTVFNMLSAGDPIAMQYFLVKHSMAALCLPVLYFIFCKFVSPIVMKSFKRQEMRLAVFTYDLLSVIANTYIVKRIVSLLAREGVSSVCEDSAFFTTAVRMEAIEIVHWLYVLKYVEMLDTIFMILRKKFSQVTYLHVYHHAANPLLFWISLRSQRRYSLFMYALLNCIVHVIMYSYYTIAALGPQFQKYLKWKRFVTAVQITQFPLALIYLLYLMFSDCGQNAGVITFFVAHSVVLLIMFVNFYRKAFLKKKSTSECEKNKDN